MTEWQCPLVAPLPAFTHRHKIHFPVDFLYVSRLSLSVFCLGQATVCVNAVATSYIHQTAKRQHWSFFFRTLFILAIIVTAEKTISQ